MKRNIVFILLIMLSAHVLGQNTGTIPKAFVLSSSADRVLELSGSEVDVEYQVYLVDSLDNKIPIGKPVSGTGYALYVFIQDIAKTHTYIIVGHRKNTGCFTQMFGEAKLGCQ